MRIDQAQEDPQWTMGRYSQNAIGITAVMPMDNTDDQCNWWIKVRVLDCVFKEPELLHGMQFYRVVAKSRE